MKKIIALAAMLSVLLSCLAMSSCGMLEVGDIEIAMVTDGGNVSDSSLNQAVWNSVSEFAKANGKTYNVYHPEAQTDEAFVESLTQAVVGGAKVVVCSGRLLETAVFEVEDRFPDIEFILVDGEPRGEESKSFLANSSSAHSEDGETSVTTPNGPVVKVSKNVYCITFREEQAAFLAGYVAVRDGYTKLGFVSESDSESDMLYGKGFLQGINAAAREMGIIDRINVKFRYSGNATVEGEVQSVVEKWYASGTELVFASGTTCAEVIAAAEIKNGRVICSDSDHSTVSNLVVSSAMKLVDRPIKEALTSLVNNEYQWDTDHSGVTVYLGVSEDGIGLPTEAAAWRFGNFTVDAYESIVARMVSGEITVDPESDIITNHAFSMDFTS